MNIHGILGCLSASGMHSEVVGDVSSPSRSDPSSESLHILLTHILKQEMWHNNTWIFMVFWAVYLLLGCIRRWLAMSRLLRVRTRLRNRCTYFWLIFWNKKCDTMRHEYSWYFVLFICFWDAFGGGWRCLVSFAFDPSSESLHILLTHILKQEMWHNETWIFMVFCAVYLLLGCIRRWLAMSRLLRVRTRLRNRCTYFWLIFWNKKCDTMRHEYSWYFVLFICFWDAFGGGWRCLVSFAFGPVFGIAAHTSDSYSETRNVTQWEHEYSWYFVLFICFWDAFGGGWRCLVSFAFGPVFGIAAHTSDSYSETRNVTQWDMNIHGILCCLSASGMHSEVVGDVSSPSRSDPSSESLHILLTHILKQEMWHNETWIFMVFCAVYLLLGCIRRWLAMSRLLRARTRLRNRCTYFWLIFWNKKCDTVRMNIHGILCCLSASGMHSEVVGDVSSPSRSDPSSESLHILLTHILKQEMWHNETWIFMVFCAVYLLLGCIRRWLAMSRLLRVRTRLRNRCTYFWLIFWNKKCDTIRHEYSWYFGLFICFWDAFGGGWRCFVSFAFGPVFGIAAHTSDSYSETRNVTQ